MGDAEADRMGESLRGEDNLKMRCGRTFLIILLI